MKWGLFYWQLGYEVEEWYAYPVHLSSTSSWTRRKEMAVRELVMIKVALEHP